VVGRGLREALPLDAYVLGVWGTSALCLAALAAVAATPLYPYPPRTVAAFVALAVVTTLGGHGLVNWSLRRLPAPTVGLFLLGEPVGATLLAFLLFGEAPGAWAVSGGLVVLAALATVILEARR
jgi:drug/metabolite transporter (DMT)-like permease